MSLNDEGRLPENILYFCKALRRAGLSVGPAQVKDAITAVAAVGFSNREDFHVTLRATLVTKSEHLQVFDQVFDLFWRDPEILENMITNLLPVINAPPRPKKPKAAEHRAAQAMAGNHQSTKDLPSRDEIELDARFSLSSEERILNMDFDQMSLQELNEAKSVLANLDLQLSPIASRRYKPSSHAVRIDRRKALQLARRTGGEVMYLPRISQQHQTPDIVALCDISGSMSVYSRMMMHFMHALSTQRRNQNNSVHTFTFGTSLSNVTRALKVKDPDEALAAVGQQVSDWKGGTRIGQSLKIFNKDWSRRVLGTNTVLLLITDGLERDDTVTLSKSIEVLARSCREVIWLNPLLRWDGFSPLACGIQALLPHVDRFLACHSLASLSALGTILSNSPNAGHRYYG